jgi:hypothetical protein
VGHLERFKAGTVLFIGKTGSRPASLHIYVLCWLGETGQLSEYSMMRAQTHQTTTVIYKHYPAASQALEKAIWNPS